jgi:stage IV sporulation protein FB
VINWTFILWPFLLWSFGFTKGIQVFTILTASLLFHEYAHILAAKSVGFVAQDVTLFIFGGAARIPGLLDMRPKQEAYVAAAGPVSSFVLALLFFVMLYVVGQPLWFLQYAVGINIILGIFNILPIFPMDGGRILRALLSYKFGQKSGTTAAVWVTVILGGLITIVSIMYGQWNMAVIMVLIILMANGERSALVSATRVKEYKERLEGMGYDVEIKDGTLHIGKRR